MALRRVMIIAGEASGDLHGAQLARAMRRLDPDIRFKGMGGKQMAAADVGLVADASSVSVVGIAEVVPALGRIVTALRSIRRALKSWRPDLLVLIDFPDFNLRVAKTAHALKIPILYYICPQVWAWRKGRVKLFRELIDRLAVILPFEETFWRKNGVKATYVGHPLLDLPEFDQVGVPPKKADRSKIVGLLPGSRQKEIDMHLPLLVSAAKKMNSIDPTLKFGMALSGDRYLQQVADCLKTANMEALCEVTTTGARELFPQCDLVIAASGTVTLEAALAKVPTVVIYRLSPISYWIGKSVIRVPFISLPNLIANEPVFPELIQKEATPGNIVQSAMALLENDNRRQRLIRRLEGIQRRLGSSGAAHRVAQIALQMMPVRERAGGS